MSKAGQWTGDMKQATLVRSMPSPFSPSCQWRILAQHFGCLEMQHTGGHIGVGRK